MLVTTLLVIVGTLLSPDAATLCRTINSRYDFAQVQVGDCVTLAKDGDVMSYVITEIQTRQVLGSDDGYGEWAFDGMEMEGNAFMYKMIERHTLTPIQSIPAGRGLQAA